MRKQPNPTLVKTAPGRETRQLLTAAQIAQIYQVTSRTVFNWFYSGKIKAAMHHGRVIRFDPDHVASSLSDQKALLRAGQRHDERNVVKKCSTTNAYARTEHSPNSSTFTYLPLLERATTPPLYTRF